MASSCWTCPLRRVPRWSSATGTRLAWEGWKKKTCCKQTCCELSPSWKKWKSASRQKHWVYCWKGVIFLSLLRFSLESRHNIFTRQSQGVRMCSSSSGWWFRRVCLLGCTRHYKHSREYSKRKRLKIVDSKRHPPSLVACCLLLIQYCIVFYSHCI